MPIKAGGWGGGGTHARSLLRVDPGLMRAEHFL